MNSFLAFEILHVLATVILFGCALGLAWWSWQLHRGVASGLAARLFRYPALFGGLIALSAISLPASGWWLATLAGWPLSQTWLLGGSLVYLVGCLSWLLLAKRVTWAAGATALIEPGPRLRIDLALAGFGLLAFIAILLLMLVKPL